MTKHLIIALALAFAGCGTDALGTNDQSVDNDMVFAGVDLASHDLAKSVDMAYSPRQDGGPLLCGSAPCGGTDKCCISTQLDGGTAGQTMCEASCGAGSIRVDCRGPSQCGGNPCCVALGAGGKISNVTCSASDNDCKPAIDIASQTGQTRLCEIDGDCTAGAPTTQLNKCCTVMAMGQSQHLCLNTTFAGFIGGTCP